MQRFEVELANRVVTSKELAVTWFMLGRLTGGVDYLHEILNRTKEEEKGGA